VVEIWKLFGTGKGKIRLAKNRLGSWRGLVEKKGICLPSQTDSANVPKTQDTEEPEWGL
jgi:hypothetical protein